MYVSHRYIASPPKSQIALSKLSKGRNHSGRATTKGRKHSGRATTCADYHLGQTSLIRQSHNLCRLPSDPFIHCFQHAKAADTIWDNVHCSRHAKGRKTVFTDLKQSQTIRLFIITQLSLTRSAAQSPLYLKPSYQAAPCQQGVRN
jgi:hypothetical protein